MCVCVCEGERERDNEREREITRERDRERKRKNECFELFLLNIIFSRCPNHIIFGERKVLEPLP